MTFAPKWRFVHVYIIQIFPCNAVNTHVRHSREYPFFPLHTHAVLPLDCITRSAPVWLSLAVCWSFLAGYENQSEFLAPTFPHTPSLAPTARSDSQCSLLLFFPDCNASVHKGCRDSLPACAKVKMKVKRPSQSLHCFCRIQLSCSQY